MFVELHIIQNFAPSCLNRDDTNAPKDCEFGGYRRARISSQCIKRAIRWHPGFRAQLGVVFAKRSCQHARDVAQRITEKTKKPLDETLQVARYAFQRMGFKEKGRTERLTVLLLLGEDEIGMLADEMEKHWETLNPLANENTLWERLAPHLAELLADTGEDAGMLGRLIANHRAGSANVSALQKWLELPNEDWEPAFKAVREMPEELRERLRLLLAAEPDSEDVVNAEKADDENVPKKAASLFGNQKENKAVSDALKQIARKKDKANRTTGTAEQKARRKEFAATLKAIFDPLKKMTTKAVDVAMFGRMLAEIKSGDMNVDAACQVAHAISTNRVSTMEMDFFTAVEELKDLAKSQGVEQSAGAGMMGVTEFNSSCFYRYANVDLKQLVKNLQGDKELACKTVAAFLRSSVEAIPTGKQNSMAAQNPPSLVFAVVRRQGLWSLANAFVEPARPAGSEDLLSNSIKKLDQYWANLVKAYGNDGILARPVMVLEETQAENGQRKLLQNLNDQQVSSLDELIGKVLANINGHSQPEVVQ